MEEAELLARLESVKKIKTQHGVGTEKAWLFMRVKERYAKIADEIMKEAGFKFDRLSAENFIKGLVIFGEKMMAALEQFLGYLAVVNSTPEDLSLSSNHRIIGSEDSTQHEEGEGFYLWIIDEKVLVKAFIDRICNLGSPTANIFESLMDVPLLLLKGAKEVISLRDFAENKIFRQSVEENFWNEVDVALAFQSEDVEDQEEVDRLLKLQEAYQKEDLYLCHEILKELSPTLAFCDNVSFFKEWLSHNFSDLELSCFFDGHYERAEREGTLRRLEIERRIAISAVNKISRKGISPEDMVDRAAKKEMESLGRRQSRLQNFLNGVAEPCIIEAEKQMVAESRYICVALKKNRRWLIDEISIGLAEG